MLVKFHRIAFYIFPATDTDMQDLREVGNHHHVGLVDERPYGDNQFELIERYIREFIELLHMGGERAFQIIRTLVAHIEQQSRRFLIDECGDTGIHRVLVVGQVIGHDRPAELFGQRIERPQPRVVALGRHNGVATQELCQFGAEFIRPSDMSRQDRDDIFTRTVNADDSRVGMLVHHIRCDAADADPHRPDKDDGLRFQEKISHNAVDRLHQDCFFL